MKKLALIGAILTGISAICFADAVQPIVPISQVIYGSSQKLITSNSDVTIGTSTHVLTTNKGILTSSVTFKDGSVLTSTTGILATSAWGSITGSIGSQADLIAKFTGVGVSTTAIASTVTAQGLSLTAIAVSTTALNSSTNTIQTQLTAHTATLTALAVSTANIITSTTSLQTQITALGVSTNTLATSTATLSSQISGLASTYLTNSSATANVLYLSSAAATYLQQAVAAINYVSQSSAIANLVSLSSVSATYQQQTLFATTSASGTLSASDWNRFNAATVGSIQTINPSWGLTGGGSSSIVTLAVSSVSLSTQAFGNLPVSELNSGTNASATTFWRGDGSWSTVTPNAQASTLATYNNVTRISSPTVALIADSTTIVAYAIGASSAGFSVNTASVTVQGNNFNGANQLVQMTSGAQYPALNGNLITSLNASNISGTITAPYFLSNTNTLQSGATVYLTTGTIKNLNVSTITFPNGSTISAAYTGNYIQNTNIPQASAVFSVASGTINGPLILTDPTAVVNPIMFSPNAGPFGAGDYGPTLFYQGRPVSFPQDSFKIAISSLPYDPTGSSKGTITGIWISPASPYDFGSIDFRIAGNYALSLTSPANTMSTSYDFTANSLHGKYLGLVSTSNAYSNLNPSPNQAPLSALNFYLPSSSGTLNQPMVTDGNGNLSFSNVISTLTVPSTITSTSGFIGNGSGLINITASNISSGALGASVLASSITWQSVNSIEKTRTRQTFSSGSGTYTKPNGVLYINVRMIGGGGGGGGSGATASGGNGGTGVNSTFGSSLLTANGGGGGSFGAGSATGGVGGGGTISSPATGYITIGGNGSTSGSDTVVANNSGGIGGNGVFGGGGASSYTGVGGSTGTVNTGGGGAGAPTGGVAEYSGLGGGAGGYIDAIIANPSTTYSYTVGTGGTYGTAGTSGYTGGGGGSGIIVVDEFYQ